MRGVSFVILLGVLVDLSRGQFLNNRPFPTYSLDNMPDTDFTCRDKILGGYYADRETQCQMFHVCVKVSGVGVQDFRFLCPNGTAFDQDHQICADWDDVDCDATTLYYSSDNFDLYRLGSGFESKAVKYGEEEETFALQRAETGDVRLNREHQSNRVNQQTDYNTAAPRRSHNQQRQNSDRDIFKTSSSSNFYNNRNGGKETEDEEYEVGNANQDQRQKKKVVRKLNRRPENNQNNDETQTPRASRPTGFVNNFAGSSYVPTTSRPISTTTNEPYSQPANQRHRSSQRVRGNGQRQYDNADNFRQNTKGSENEFTNQNGQNAAQTPQYAVSTPAPFHQTQQYNRQTTQYNNGQYYSTTAAPKQTDNYPTTPAQQIYNTQHSHIQGKEVENYPTTAAERSKNTQYESTKVKQPENYPTTNSQQYYENRQTTPAKQTGNQRAPDNYPTTQYNNQKTVKQPDNQRAQENYPSTQYNSQKTPVRQNDNQRTTDNYPTTQYNNQKTPVRQNDNQRTFDNYPTTQYNNQKTPLRQTENQRTPENYSTQYNNQKTPVRQNNNQRTTDNYPTAQYNNQKTPIRQNDSQRTTDNYPTAQYNNQKTPVRQPDSYRTPENYPTTQYNNQKTPENYPTTFAPKIILGSFTQPTTHFTNGQQSTYNQPSSNSNFDNTRSTNNRQPPTNQQTPSTQFQKQTTQFTQYTPTVPKVTTTYYSSTTPSSKFSNRYDETSYDDGSYHSKYDNYDSEKKTSTTNKKQEDEFLNTAHSTNIASSKNEYDRSTKNSVATTQKPYYESPRPFSVSFNTPKATDFTKTSQTFASNPPTAAPPVNTKNIGPAKEKKKDTNTSYDYAYYDTNVGSEPDYDIGTEIEKSSKVKNKQQ